MAQYYAERLLESNLENQTNNLQQLLEGAEECHNNDFYSEFPHQFQPAGVKGTHNFPNYQVQNNNSHHSLQYENYPMTNQPNVAYSNNQFAMYKPNQPPYNPHQQYTTYYDQVREFNSFSRNDASPKMKRSGGGSQGKSFYKKMPNRMNSNRSNNWSDPRKHNSSFFDTPVPESEISLQALGINCTRNDPSLYKMLLLKLKNCCFILNQLSKERCDIQRDLFKQSKNEFKMFDAGQEIHYNNIPSYLEYIINASNNEYCIVKLLISNMEYYCTTTLKLKKNQSDLILLEFTESITKVQNLLSSSDAMLLQPSDINDDDINEIMAIIEDLILSIKYTQNYLWCLKTSIQYAAVQRNRATFVGS